MGISSQTSVSAQHNRVKLSHLQHGNHGLECQAFKNSPAAPETCLQKHSADLFEGSVELRLSKPENESKPLIKTARRYMHSKGTSSKARPSLASWAAIWLSLKAPSNPSNSTTTPAEKKHLLQSRGKLHPLQGTSLPCIHPIFVIEYQKPRLPVVSSLHCTCKSHLVTSDTLALGACLLPASDSVPRGLLLACVCTSKGSSSCNAESERPRFPRKQDGPSLNKVDLSLAKPCYSCSRRRWWWGARAAAEVVVDVQW